MSRGYSVAMRISAQTLAKLLYEEFERNDWGDIDPWLFKYVAEDKLNEAADARALCDVLRRVLERAQDYEDHLRTGR